ncbi:hypothetical protein K1W54_04140 [Micromonospora sp. CPCC 205371]|nr:hypothetical protein [Micromonospora sp. CPCC 205371]
MLVDVLLPLPPNQLRQFIRDLSAQVAASGPLPNMTVERLGELAHEIRGQGERIPDAARDDWLRLADIVDSATSD